MKKIKQYRTLVFDCDGVVLDSNKVKTEAFYKAALPYGENAAQALVDYHVAHGGISRYKKFAWFLQELVPLYAPKKNGPNLDALLRVYASKVLQGLLTCDIAPGLEKLRDETEDSRWLIVSGGDQDELRKVFAERGLTLWFDGGVFGSPDTKEKILAGGLLSGNIREPAIFFGDSKYDYLAAVGVGLDFAFLHGWTELKDWHEWCKKENIIYFENIAEVLN